MTSTTDKKNIVEEIEKFLTDYSVFQDDSYKLPIALWIAGTFAWPNFDVFPYMCITATTKRSGKTRLSELIGFTCSNPRNTAAMSAAAMYNSIKDEQPTLIMDEAESLGSEAATDIRTVLNVGYRKGQVVTKAGKGGLVEYQTYCPKIFILIGDVFDTLRDRSIIVKMRRGNPKEMERLTKFRFESVKERGALIREKISQIIRDDNETIANAYLNYPSMEFLTDRDEEIWTPLFVLCEHLCPNRIKELQRVAVDMATEKTAPKIREVDSADKDKAAMEDEYSQKLLHDALEVMGKEKAIRTSELLSGLKELTTAPWRKYLGVGIDEYSLSNLLNRHEVSPKPIRFGKGRNAPLARGYTKESINKAIAKL